MSFSKLALFPIHLPEEMRLHDHISFRVCVYEHLVGHCPWSDSVVWKRHRVRSLWSGSRGQRQDSGMHI